MASCVGDPRPLVDDVDDGDDDGDTVVDVVALVVGDDDMV